MERKRFNQKPLNCSICHQPSRTLSLDYKYDQQILTCQNCFRKKYRRQTFQEDVVDMCDVYVHTSKLPSLHQAPKRDKCTRCGEIELNFKGECTRCSYKPNIKIYM